jgi:hypothetical protein
MDHSLAFAVSPQIEKGARTFTFVKTRKCTGCIFWRFVLTVFSLIRLILFHSTRMVLQSYPFSQDLFKAFRFVIHAVVPMGRLTGDSAEHCAKLEYRSSLQ